MGSLAARRFDGAQGQEPVNLFGIRVGELAAPATEIRDPEVRGHRTQFFRRHLPSLVPVTYLFQRRAYGRISVQETPPSESVALLVCFWTYRRLTTHGRLATVQRTVTSPRYATSLIVFRPSGYHLMHRGRSCIVRTPAGTLGNDGQLAALVSTALFTSHTIYLKYKRVCLTRSCAVYIARQETATCSQLRSSSTRTRARLDMQFSCTCHQVWQVDCRAAGKPWPPPAPIGGQDNRDAESRDV